jgi:hypothetical protein
MRLHMALTAAVLAAGTSTASAQRMPDFATLDRTDGFSKFGLDVGFLKIDRADISSVLRLEPYGQLVSQQGLGAYLALPLARSFGDVDEGALGNLDLGGLYVISGADISFAFRLGLVVPTASEGAVDFVVNSLATHYRLTDISLTNPDAWYARLAFSPLIHTRSLFLRFDLGADIPFAEDDFRADPILRLNVGGGVDLGLAALMLELVTIADVDDDDDDPDQDEDLFHTIAVTARFMHSTLQPFVTVGTPIDDQIRESVDFFIGFGIQGVLH